MAFSLFFQGASARGLGTSIQGGSHIARNKHGRLIYTGIGEHYFPTPITNAPNPAKINDIKFPIRKILIATGPRNCSESESISP